MKQKECLHCKAPRTDPGSFCNDDCKKAWDRARKAKAWAERPALEVQCQNPECGKTFSTRDRRKEGCCTKCTHALQRIAIQAEYGVDNPSQIPKSPERKEAERRNKSAASKKASVLREPKRQETYLKKYGTLSMAELPGVREKITETNTERYGGASPFSSEDVRQKARSSFQATFGTDTFVQSPAWKAQNLAKYGTEQIFDSDEFLAMERTLTSQGEVELREFIQSLQLNPRKIRRETPNGDRMEVDIFVEERSVGFEYDGLYWHCELNKYDDPESGVFNRLYHHKKTQFFATQGIQVIHVYESEWKRTQAAVKSRIRAILGRNSHRAYARACEIKALSKAEANDFFKRYHLQGGTIHDGEQWGLFYQGDLVAAVKVENHHRQNGLGQKVLSRFVVKEDWSVPGALSRLTKHASRHLKTDIITWADLRWSTGKGYQSAGWDLLAKNPPSYDYTTRDFRGIISKQARKKSNCPPPEPGMSEHEWANRQGHFQIWNCGKLTFIYRYQP